ncbi:MAG: cyclodeaminase/cyclohydrolase family protein [Anaerolineae bacterium]|nr:MAG: cyclodeaminase/cyclohydrolase family protein [Anaerolineae bacterium]
MTERLTDKTVSIFLDELASSAPAPGGGSVAALSGALGAALVSMVCNLTVGKKRFADVEQDVKAILEKSESLRHRLIDLLQADVKAYTAVSQAMKMPRATDEEKAMRAEAMQKALKHATEVPMQVAAACVEVIGLCQPVAEKGNKNAVSDAGVAILMAEAGLRSAALNILINLGWIEDQSFNAEKQQQLDTLLEGKPTLRDQVYDYVVENL